MGTTLTGTFISQTYDSLLKVTDNDNLTSTAKRITDGLGNDSPLFVSTSRVGIGVTPTTTFQVSGNSQLGGNLTVTGNLIVQGTTTTVDTDTLSVKDPLIIVGSDNTSSDAVDLGFYGVYDTSGSLDLYAGLYRDASDAKFHLFKDLQTEPTTTVNKSATGYTVATLVSNLEGNVTGNVSGSSATVTGAAQTAITSVGTLTALQVDNININGNTISSTAGTDLNITPLAGQQIVLDGTIVIDAGVVTGATSITSTSFVGELTGNASTSTKIASITNSNIVQLTSSQTLTNKTIDVDNNTVSNIEVDNFKASAIVIESEGIGSNDNDTTLPTSAAVKDYVDGQVTAQDLDFAGGSGTGAVDLDSQTFTVAGTTNEIETSASGQTLTVGLPNSVTITTNIGSPIFSTGEGVNNKIFFLGNYGNWRINISDSANQLVIHSESLATDYFTVIGGGGIKLNAYGSGNKTGTVAKNLAVDSSGNIIETDGGVVDGSGTANDVAMWSDANTLTDAPIAISGNDANFAGTVSVNGAGSASSGSLSLVSSDSFIRINTTGGTTDKQKWDIRTVSASGFEALDFRTVNDANNSFSTKLSLAHSGAATFAGSVGVAGSSIVEKFNTPNIKVSGSTITGTVSANTLLIDNLSSTSRFFSCGADSSTNGTFNFNTGTSAALGATMLTLASTGATFAGNLGIGLTPSVKLEIKDSTHTTMKVRSGNDDNIFFAQAIQSSDSRIGTETNTDFTIHTNGAERIRVENTGEVGINETSPSSYFTTDLVVKAKADLGGITIRSNATSHNNYLMFADGTSGNEAYRGYINYDHTNDKLNFASAATLALTIDSSQRVGIGSTGETYGADKLTIKGSNKGISSSPGGNLAVFTSDSVAADKGGSIVLGGTYSGTTPYQFAGIAGLKDNSTAGQAGGYLAFYTTNQSNASPERMRLDSSGNLDLTSGGILKGMSVLELKNNGSTDGSATSPRLYSPASGALAFSANGSQRMLLDSSGNLIVNDTSADLSSSGRGVVEINGTSQAILGLKVNGDVKTYLFQNGDNVELNNTASGSLTLKTAATNAVTIDSSQNATFAGNVTLSSGFVNLPAGTETDPSLIFAGDDDTGLWHPASNTLAFSTFGSERMRIDSSGKVGIGTDSPGSILDVVDTSGTTTLTLGRAGEVPEIKAGGTNTDLRLSAVGSGGFLDFQTNGNSRIIIKSDGNVGIGTTTPNEKLVVGTTGGTQNIEISNSYIQSFNRSGSAGYQSLSFNASSYAFNIGAATFAGVVKTTGASMGTTQADGDYLAKLYTASADGFLELFTGEGTPVSRIKLSSYGDSYFVGTSTGRVGIGTTSPNVRAEIKASVNGNPVTSGSTQTNGALRVRGSATNVLDIGQQSASPYGMWMQVCEATSLGVSYPLLLNPNGGDILFGTDTKANDFAYFDAESNNRRVLNLGSSSTSEQTLVNFRNPNGVVGGVSTDGSSTSFSGSSDYRLKENVVEMTDALDRVSQLKPSKFNFIGEEKTLDGFLAHEVQDIVPQAIIGTKDKVDEQGNPVYQQIDQSKLVPLLVGAIQELQKRIEILENK
jgi:hypothetical protein